MAEFKTLDVHSLIPAERHRSIFVTYGRLAMESTFILINDYDPKPLYYQFEAERRGEFSWRYREQWPEVWQVEISRAKAPAAVLR